MSENNSQENSKIDCQYCSSKNSITSVFCQSCGKRIRGEEPSEQTVNGKIVWSYQPQAPTMNLQSTTLHIPKSHRSRNIIIAVIAVILVGILVTALVSYGTSKIEITGLNIQIQYNGSDQGYFGPTSQSVGMSNQPTGILEINRGQQFLQSFTFTESALAPSGDSINYITVTTPGFTIISIDPSTPIAFSPGSTVRITVTFQSPQTSYNGAVTLILSTWSGLPNVG